MTYSRTQLEELLNRIRTGAPDLSTDEIDALAIYINQSPAAAARLAEDHPQLGSLSAADLPRPAEWDRVWSGIDAALPEIPRLTIVHADELAARERLTLLLSDEDSRAHGSRRRWTALSWPGLVAAAACILVVALFRLPLVDRQDVDALQLAANIEILDIDAMGDATPLLVPLVGGSQVLIWSFDDNGA